MTDIKDVINNLSAPTPTQLEPTKPKEKVPAGVYMFHNYHIHGRWHDVEYLMVTNGDGNQQWRYRNVFDRDVFMELKGIKAEPGEASPGVGDNWWAVTDNGITQKLRPLHRTTERTDFGAYPAYASRDDDRYSVVPINTKLPEGSSGTKAVEQSG